MNKSKNIITILAVVVIILVVFLIYSRNLQMNSKEILKYKQNMIDMEFKYQLGESAACFSRDFTDGNNSNYESCVGSVAAASAVSKPSSYEATNDLIDVGLDGLYKAMINGDKKEIVIGKAEKIRNIFIKLNLDPTDIKTTDELNSLVASLYK
ncbi:hypothetical protein [Paenibacillus favisporus]|uniref:hypothetical protein n=1 Tax=Paenibacillus favisporus TaxID=221028 RepID=UPI003D267984